MATKPAKKKPSLGRKSWSGFLTLGLVSIPVSVYAARISRQSEKLSLNMICPDHKIKLKQQYYCSECDKSIERDLIAKGYDFEPGGPLLLVESDFLEKISPESNKIITINKFVIQDDIEIFMLDTPYFMVPEDAGLAAYSLLRDALSDTDTAAIGRIVMSGREQIVSIVPQEGGIVMYTLNPISRIKDSKPFFEGLEGTPQPEMKKMMKKLISSKLTAGFEESDFEDKYETLLLEGIQARIDGKEITAPTVATKKVDPNDLMAALMASM
jgi:DNA end-binding protein Ku